MTSKFTMKFCKYCQEKTVHYGLKCSSCESTSDTDTDWDSCDREYDSDGGCEFIVNDSE